MIKVNVSYPNLDENRNSSIMDITRTSIYRSLKKTGQKSDQRPH